MVTAEGTERQARRQRDKAIGDRLTLASFEVIEQQAEFGGAVGGPHRLECGQSLEIERDDMTEALKPAPTEPSPEAGMNMMRKAVAKNDLAKLKTRRKRINSNRSK